jgi:transposase
VGAGYVLSDAEWDCLEPLLPVYRPGRGRPPVDHRLVIDALLWLARTGAPWRTLPERFGPWRTIATRFYRWTASGLWKRIMDALLRRADHAGELDWSRHMIDSTTVRAHQHAAGAKGGSRAMRSAAPAAASPPRSTSAATAGAAHSSST